MLEASVTMSVRVVDPAISIIDIKGEINGFAEDALMNAYSQASSPTTHAIILNFGGVEYMNSSGIGLLVTLMIRMNRQRQHLFAYGVSEHYQHIFELTRLSEAIGMHESEPAAVAAAARMTA